VKGRAASTLFAVSVVAVASFAGGVWTLSTLSKPAAPRAEPSPAGVAPTGFCALRGKASGAAVIYVKNVPKASWTPRSTRHRFTVAHGKLEPAFEVAVRDETVDFVPLDGEQHALFSVAEQFFELGRSSTADPGTYSPSAPGLYHVQCDLHANESATLLVVRNPFFAAVGSDGSWQLENVPAGNYELVGLEANGGTSSVRVDCLAGETVTAPALEVIAAQPPVHRHKDLRPYRIE
jgi:hypothetical protein